MADEKQPPPDLRRRLAGDTPTPAPSSPTQENPPLEVGGHIQWKNLPVWGRWLGGAVAAFLLAVMPALQQWRASRAEEAARVAEIKAAKVDERAKQAQGTGTQAKSAAEAGYQVVKPLLENIQKRMDALEAREARRERKAGSRRQIAAPQKPKPLPPDLNAAERQVAAKTEAAPPTAPPAQPHPSDAGQ